MLLFFLLTQGVLDIPKVGGINVKQAHAFLWSAAWLQEFMNKRWRADGAITTDMRTDKWGVLDTFGLAIMGPGGTGKTTVLRTVEALTEFFVGPDTVRKLAPSNAAARLLGGDTLHALCKLLVSFLWEFRRDLIGILQGCVDSIGEIL